MQMVNCYTKLLPFRSFVDNTKRKKNWKRNVIIFLISSVITLTLVTLIIYVVFHATGAQFCWFTLTPPACVYGGLEQAHRGRSTNHDRPSPGESRRNSGAYLCTQSRWQGIEVNKAKDSWKQTS